jgi:hypothetical protein
MHFAQKVRGVLDESDHVGSDAVDFLDQLRTFFVGVLTRQIAAGNLICRNLVSSSEKIRDARGIFDVRSRHSAELPAAVLDLRRIYRSVTRYSKCSLQCIMAAISFAAIGHRIMEARHLRGIQPRSTAVQYAAR